MYREIVTSLTKIGSTLWETKFEKRVYAKTLKNNAFIESIPESAVDYRKKDRTTEYNNASKDHSPQSQDYRNQ